MLIREFHVLELWIEMNVYDPCSFLLYQSSTAPSWPDSSTGRDCTSIAEVRIQIPIDA